VYQYPKIKETFLFLLIATNCKEEKTLWLTFRETPITPSNHLSSGKMNSSSDISGNCWNYPVR
jgi:hypothetical protein